MTKLTLLTQSIKKYNTTVELKANVLNALYNFGVEDNDFNGKNGAESLWAEAQGYDSNIEYLLDTISVHQDIGKMIYEYFDEWLGHDCYYDSYDYNIIRNEANEIIAIALAYAVEM